MLELVPVKRVYINFSPYYVFSIGGTQIKYSRYYKYQF